MSIFRLYIIFLFLSTISLANMYIRIEKGGVNKRIGYFLRENNIYDCFERLDTEENILALRCLHNDYLYDVNILVDSPTYYIKSPKGISPFSLRVISLSTTAVVTLNGNSSLSVFILSLNRLCSGFMSRNRLSLL